MIISRVVIAFGISSVVLCLNGCSSEWRPPATVLSGTVTIDRSPIPVGVVTAYQNGSKVMETTIDVDGTYAFPDPPSGEYQLTVTGTDQSSSYGKPVKLPAKYAKPETSGLTATVTSGQVSTQDLLLKTK